MVRFAGVIETSFSAKRIAGLWVKPANKTCSREFPHPSDPKGAWLSITDLGGVEKPVPADLSSKEIDPVVSAFRDLMSSYRAQNKSAVIESATLLSAEIRKIPIHPGLYPSSGIINLELHYAHLHPFRLAWVFYLIGFLSLLLSFGFRWKGLSLIGLIGTIAGFCFQGYGFILRSIIAGRPPVTNMYETVIWVTWGAVLFSLILYFVYKKRILLTASAAVAIIGLILADNLPSVLDPSINTLVPVLRSNFWLTIHVLTINLGYAGMALAAGLGNIVIGRILFGSPKDSLIKEQSKLIYRAMQIGLILLTAGTILGGVWADQSWGRFWGWDPKEVWALIAILTYLSVLHGRMVGWIKDFGTAAGAAICFLTIVMAWYGVNYVLGVGLHSYGFGTGGVQYVIMYAVAQIAFVVAAYLKSKSRLRKASA